MSAVAVRAGAFLHHLQLQSPDPEKLACLLYTSGTSGRPRAAMLTHRALIANIDQAAQVDPLAPLAGFAPFAVPELIGCTRFELSR